MIDVISKIPDWLPLVLSIPLAIITSHAIQRRRPHLVGTKLAFMSALPGFVAVMLLGCWLLYYVFAQPVSPDEIDASGMAMAAIMFITPLKALVVLCIGMISVSISRRVRRR